MRWPWQRSTSADRLIIAWADRALAYVLATPAKDGTFEVQRFGVERQGTDSDEDFAKRLAGLDIKGCQTLGMLQSGQYQLLQIEAPAVAPEELRAAARWKIRDMVDVHLDDLTLDVMRVGEEQGRSAGNLFVVAASNALIREVIGMSKAMRCPLEVIDIQGLAQRNIQTALAQRKGRLERAHAAIVLTNERYALLTISAKEELYYKRRIDLGEGFLQDDWPSAYAATEISMPQTAFEGDNAGFEDYAAPPRTQTEDYAQRFVVEVQRSLDLWERTWQDLPLEGVNVYAGVRTGEMVRWLSGQLMQSVSALDVSAVFHGFEGGTAEDRLLCWPLLGALLRTESRKL